jgi:hypothetical protein
LNGGLAKHWRVLLIGAIVSLAAIYFVVKQININQLARALSEANYLYALPAAGLIVLGLAARSVRWRILLDRKLSLWRSFNIINVTYLVNGLLPFRVGELARAYLANRNEPPIPIFTSFSTIIVERLLDTLAVLIIMALAVTAAPLPAELRAAAALFTPLVLIGFAVLIVLAINPARSMRIIERFAPKTLNTRWNIVSWFGHFLDGLKPLTQIRPLIAVILWTAISWSFSLASGYVLMIAFFGAGNWAATCLFTAAASFAVAVPAVPGNVGTYEAAIIVSLQALNIGGINSTAGVYENAVAFAIVVHGLNLAVVAVLGVFGFIQEGVTLEQLSQGTRSLQERQDNIAGEQVS